MAGLLVLWALVCGCGDGPRQESSTAVMVDAARALDEASAADVTTRAQETGLEALGEGFVVWEANRGGGWRIWIRELGDRGISELRQLSPDEAGRSHCCAHISPDGEWIAYVSLPLGGEKYLKTQNTGPLHLIRPDGSNDQVVVDAARTYFENRAAIWRSAGELIFIDDEGRTRLLDLDRGEARFLTESTREFFGWLIDPGLAYATHGRPAFSPYDADSRTIAERDARGGCQPYFSGDGRWGYWVAGAGGPINRVELASGEISTVIRKNDPRIWGDFGYLYFPMFSRDGAAFAFAASPGDHSHMKSNYEVFVAESDPETLELIGPVVRVSEDPGPDRFPDVFLTPLDLGRHSGEAPMRIELRPPGESADWRWTFGDGESARGDTGEHEYRAAGSYRVEASRPGKTYKGIVRVRPPAPPRLSKMELVDRGNEIRLHFDEEIAVPAPEMSLESGLEIESWSIGDNERSLRLFLQETLTAYDRLSLKGITDRAQRPNAVAPMTLEIEPPLWPSGRHGVVLLWQRGDASNLAFDEALDAERATVLTRRGRAVLDHDFAMLLAGGSFVASADDANRLRWAGQATNELSLEAVVGPPVDPTPRLAYIMSLSQGGQGLNFALAEKDGRLSFIKGPREIAQVDLVELPRGRSSHLVLTYAPGNLVLFLDGRKVLESAEPQGDFFHWRSLRLTFGDEWAGGHDWVGRLEGIAIYNRLLEADEVHENFLRYQALMDQRPTVPRTVVEGRLKRTSAIPTLDEIRPYREALAVFEYEVDRVLEGEGAETVLVAHWVILDGEEQRLARASTGDSRRLILEPFELNLQLEGSYLSDTLDERGPLYYSPNDHP